MFGKSTEQFRRLHHMSSQPIQFTFPAICKTCSLVFPGPTFATYNNVQITMEGSQAGPCPGCGGYGDIIDGTFSLVGDTIRRLTDGLSFADILRLRKAAEKARSNGGDLVAFSKEVSGVPELESFAQWMKDYFVPKSGADLATYLGFLITILTLLSLLPSSAPAPAPLSEQQITEITVRAVNATFAENEKKLKKLQQRNAVRAKPTKVGRNDPCACGSGKKHKRCCL